MKTIVSMSSILTMMSHKVGFILRVDLKAETLEWPVLHKEIIELTF